MSKETLQKQNHNMGSVSFMEKFLFFDQVFVINTHVQKKKKIKFWVDRPHQTLMFIVSHHHLTISKHNLTKKKKKPYTKKKEKKKGTCETFGEEGFLRVSLRERGFFLEIPISVWLPLLQWLQALSFCSYSLLRFWYYHKFHFILFVLLFHWTSHCITLLYLIGA